MMGGAGASAEFTVESENSTSAGFSESYLVSGISYIGGDVPEDGGEFSAEGSEFSVSMGLLVVDPRSPTSVGVEDDKLGSGFSAAGGAAAGFSTAVTSGSRGSMAAKTGLEKVKIDKIRVRIARREESFFILGVLRDFYIS